jgi:hypothetical protein
MIFRTRVIYIICLTAVTDKLCALLRACKHSVVERVKGGGAAVGLGVSEASAVSSSEFKGIEDSNKLIFMRVS